MKARLTAVSLALVLVTVACGTRVSQEDIEAADTGRGRPASVTEPVTDGAATFGTLPSPCGPGDASGATDVGVTDTEISITTIADPANTVTPGLNQGVFDSMVAFEKWCNDQGGINGRRVKVNQRDSKLFEYQAQVVAACDSDLAMVGNLGVLDEQGVSAQEGCGIPNIPAATVSADQGRAANTISPLPNPVDEFLVGPGRWIADSYPDAITNAAALRSKLSITENQSNRQMDAYEQVGFNFNYVEAAAVGTVNWAPMVVAMKNQGIDYMTLTSSFEEIIPLQKEMALQGFDPEVVELEANFYNNKYPEQAGDAADGTLIRLTVWPFEEAEENAAMTAYLGALKAAVPGAQPELLGVQAFSAALLWATAVQELGSEVTRVGLLDRLGSIHEWDGGGLHGRSDPGANIPAGCFIMMSVADGGFRREYPGKDDDAETYEAGNGFDCAADNQIDLLGTYTGTSG